MCTVSKLLEIKLVFLKLCIARLVQRLIRLMELIKEFVEYVVVKVISIATKERL